MARWCQPWIFLYSCVSLNIRVVMVLSLGPELRGIQFSSCSSRGCWRGPLLGEAPGAEPSCLCKATIPLRRQTSKGGCWLNWKYSQPSISYRICFSNYLYFSLMTQYKAKWLLAKLQVAERSRAFGHVSSTCWSVLQAGGEFLFSVFYIFSREHKGVQLSMDAGVGMGFLFFNTKQRHPCHWDQQRVPCMLETAHDWRGYSLFSDPRGKNLSSFVHRQNSDHHPHTSASNN